MQTVPRGTILYITLFLVLSMPFALALLPQNFNNTEFSIYNENWDGLSEFRAILTNNYPDVNLKTLLGSANALNRLNESVGADAGSLVIMGPKIHYDPFEAIAILLYAAKGGRVLIADDFGTSNDVLNYFSMLIELLANTVLDGQTSNLFGIGSGENICTTNKSNPFPIVGLAINQSVLVDTQSYYKSPVQPIFTPPPTTGLSGTTYSTIAPWLSPLVENVDSVIGNYAATISMKVRYPTNFTNLNNKNDVIDSDTYYGLLNPLDKCNYNPTTFEILWVPFSEFPASLTTVAGIEIPPINISLKLSALYSSQKSWLEFNTTAARNVENIKPDSSEWGNVEFPIAINFPFGTSASSGSLTIISDPSIFINRYIKQDTYPICQDGINFADSCEQDADFNPNNYDNRQFVTNIINLLTSDRPDGVIYFDEGHLSQSYISPTMYLGTFFRLLDFMSMVPFIAPFLPFLVYGIARKLAPKGTMGRALLVTKAENYYGRSYFAYKMRWFLENRHFTRGLELIYRRVKRDLMKRYNLNEWDPEKAAGLLLAEYSNLRKNLVKKLLEIEMVLDQNLIIEEPRFMDLYLVLQEINNHIKL
jgi:hypothetical protein